MCDRPHRLATIGTNNESTRAMDQLYGCVCGYVTRGDYGMTEHIKTQNAGHQMAPEKECLGHGSKIALQLRIYELEDALQAIGNLVGGPTMTYAPTVEIQEWRKRASRISELVAEVLKASVAQAAGQE